MSMYYTFYRLDLIDVDSYFVSDSLTCIYCDPPPLPNNITNLDGPLCCGSHYLSGANTFRLSRDLNITLGHYISVQTLSLPIRRAFDLDDSVSVEQFIF